MSKDADLDMLRLEAENAMTPTRRAWALRLVERIQHLESARDALTTSMTWSKQSDRDDAAIDTDANFPTTDS